MATQYKIVENEDFADTVASLTATDDFGRKFEETGPRNMDKRVGMFYFLWNGQHRDVQKEVLDYSKCEHGETFFRPKNIDAPEAHRNAFYYWGEPLFGYYDAGDEWVLHKHIRLLTLSGVDFLALDATNAVTYDEVAEKLFAITCFYLERGIPAPKLTFYLNTETKKTLEYLYEKFYRSGCYRQAWYLENGKPLIIGNGQPKNSDGKRDYGENIYDLSPELMRFFTLRANLWPKQEVIPNAVSWMEWDFPQRNIDGTMSVSVAQHTRHPFSLSVDCDATEETYHSNWGRGFDFLSGKNDPDRVNEGINFESQWNTALRGDVHTVFVTGWNEWIAQKLYDYHIAEKKFSFVDTVNQEFSRDIEMMKGGYFDNFLLQNARNLRRFSFRQGPLRVCRRQSFDLYRLPEHFGRVYYHFEGLIDRDYPNCAGTKQYQNFTTRNNFRTMCVCDDGTRLWIRLNFYRFLDESSVCLVILTEKEKWFLRQKLGDFELCCGEHRYKVTWNKGDDFLGFEFPLEALGVSERFRLGLKAVDNADPTDAEALYTDGDVFPMGRFYLQYNAAVYFFEK